MTDQNTIPQFDAEPAGNGRVRNFSGSGVTASFESQKEVDEHEVHEAQKAAGRSPARTLKIYGKIGNSSR